VTDAPASPPLTWAAEQDAARRLRTEGRFAEAAAAYGRAADLNPAGSARLFQGLSLRDLGDMPGALAALERHVADQPDSFDGWTTLGMTRRNAGMLDQAIAPLRRALALREDPAVRNVLVTCLWRLGRMGEARVEGWRNLDLKDRLAAQALAASPFAQAALRPGGRGFDPGKPRANIIAFSLWGDRPEYITGAIVNAQIAPHLYVGWTARFYCDTSVPADARAALAQYGAQVVLMDRPEHQRIRPMWRFLASDDPEVNVFVCRDADSRLNARELLAVTAWLRSGRRFHVMRDHLYHMELILAGMWGGMAGVLPPLADWLAQGAAYFDNRWGDQAFLADLVWPLIRGDACVHDAEYRFPDGIARDFPAGYDLPGLIHVGGGVKQMPHWSRYFRLPGDSGAQ
jgi:tetratricopeptide (TPR) repeat protein